MMVLYRLFTLFLRVLMRPVWPPGQPVRRVLAVVTAGLALLALPLLGWGGSPRPTTLRQPMRVAALTPDADKDGIPDATEGTADFDGDGRNNSNDLDSDDDGIPDAVEANDGVLPANMTSDGRYPAAYVLANDTDGDGLVNARDPDNGGTALPDRDQDGDNLRNRTDRDSDGDGLTDAREANGGTLRPNVDDNGQYTTNTDINANGINDNADGAIVTSTPLPLTNTDAADGTSRPDFLDLDSDNDGATDWFEAQSLVSDNGAAPGDWIRTITAGDTDGDGIQNDLDPDVNAANALVPVNTDGADVADYIDLDSDNDGVSDRIEFQDDDHDGVADVAFANTDTDLDGLVDGYDSENNTSGTLNNGSGVNNLTGLNTLSNNGVDDLGMRSTRPNADFDYLLDFRDTDDDNDGILTSAEDVVGNYFVYTQGGYYTLRAQGGTATHEPDYLHLKRSGSRPQDLRTAVLDWNDGNYNDGSAGGAASTAASLAGKIFKRAGVTITVAPFNTAAATYNGYSFPATTQIPAGGTQAFGALTFPSNPVFQTDSYLNYDKWTGGTRAKKLRPSFFQTIGTANRTSTAIFKFTQTLRDVTIGITDLDFGAGSYEDDAEIIGYRNGVAVTLGVADILRSPNVHNAGTSTVTGSQRTVSKNTVGTVPSKQQAGNVWVSFQQPIDELRIIYRNANSLTGVQIIGLSELRFTNTDFDDDNIADGTDLDTDQDGIPDLTETAGVNVFADTDNDGIPNYMDANTVGFVDTNTDGIDDRYDNDLDGQINSMDRDSDNDGITDTREASGPDTNGDGIYDGFVDANSDGLSDGLATTPLTIRDTDGDGRANYLDRDSDNDGLTDTREANSVLLVDANNNGIADVYTGASTSYDLNLDGIADAVVGATAPQNFDGDANADYFDRDSDNDGLTDTREAGGTDANGDGVIDNFASGNAVGLTNSPLTATDFDGDGFNNYTDRDSDNDGITDARESYTDANNDGVIDGATTDANADGLYDVAVTATAPRNTDANGNANYLDRDSDDDGLADAIEGGGADANGDGIVDSFVTGSTNGITNTISAPADTDGDGLANYSDRDSDNDGIWDLLEIQVTSGRRALANADADGDGIDNNFDNTFTAGFAIITPNNNDGADAADYLDLNSDNDARLDWIEGFDNNGNISAYDDLQTRATAFVTAGGSAAFYPNGTDTNANGIPDWLDDTDADGTPNFLDFGNSYYRDSNSNGLIDLYDPASFGAPSTTPTRIAGQEADFRRANTAPVAVADVTNTPNNTAVTFAVATNDTDADGTIAPGTIDLDPATAGIQTSITVAGQGTFTTVGVTAGSVKFTPASSAFTGVASTPYTIQDTEGTTSNSASLSVNVGPLTANDASSGSYAASTSVDVTANDTDVNGLNVATVDLNPGVAGVQTTLATANGTFTAAATGVVTYTPNAGSTFTGTQSVTYVVLDNLAGNAALSSIGTYTVTLTNAAPVAVADVTNTPNNTVVTFAVTANDTDVDGNGTLNLASIDLNPATAGIQTSITVAGQGTFTTVGVPAGSVRFTPASSAFTGVATTPYTVQDALGSTSNQANLSVNVGPLTSNDASTMAYNAASTSVNVTTNDTDANGLNVATVDLDPATAGIQTSFITANGTFTAAATGVVTYTPNAGSTFTGTQSVTYVVLDNLAGNAALSSTGTYTVTLTNTAPVAVADVTNTPNNTAVTFAVTANDTDVDGNGTIDNATIDLNPATAGIQTSITVAGQGTFTTVGVPAGSVRFTPASSTFTGVATTPYTVNDQTGQVSNSANLSVNVGPLTANDASTMAYNAASTSVNVTSNDTDVNGINVATVDLNPGVAGVQTTFATANGTFTAAATGVVTYTPNAGSTFVGTQSVTYVVLDNLAGNAALSSIGTYTVGLTNAAPVAIADAANTPNNTAVTFAVTANDTDANGNGTINTASIDLDPATFGQQTSITVAGQGTFTTVGVPAGSVKFTPASSAFTGVATISYTVNDQTGQVSNSASLSVNVGPLTANDASSGSYAAGTSVDVTSNDTDVNGINAATVDLDPATAGIQTSFATANGTFTAAATGVVTYTPNAGSTFTGTQSVTYVVLDNLAGNAALSSIGTYTVTLSNTAPVAVADVTNTPNNTVVTFAVTANDTDVDGNATINLATIDLNPAVAGIQTSITVAGQGTFTTVGVTAGSVRFTPASSAFTGVATTPYTVQDALGSTSNQANLSVNVGPLTANDASSMVYNAASTSVNVTTNDTDANGINVATVDLDLVTAGIQTSFVTPNGTFTAAATGVVTYTPNLGSTFVGTQSVTYVVLDNLAGNAALSSIGTYTVTLTNTVPVAASDNFNTPNNTPVTFSPTANDSDVNGNGTIVATTIDLDPATAGQQTTRTVAGGTFTLITVGVNAGQVTFTPLNSAFTAVASVQYTVQDNAGGTSGTATISVNVGPLTADDATSGSYTAAQSINVTTNDTDTNGKNVATVDLDPATAGVQTTFDYVVGGVTVGTFSAAATGVVTYTPAVGATYLGTASVSYVFFDNLTGNAALSSVGTYTVTLTNAAPVAVANFFVTPNNTVLPASAATSIVANDTDPNGNGTINPATVDLDPTTPSVLDQTNVPATNGGGTFSVNALGQITFTPVNAAYTDIATIQYTVQDNQGQVSNAITVSVNVGPLAADDAASTAYNVLVTTNVTANDVDVQLIRNNTVDLDPTTPLVRDTSVPFVVGGVTVGTFSTNGTSSIRYTPAAGSTYVGTASVDYLVYDAQTPTATASAYSNVATYTVTLTNTAPVAIDNTIGTPQATPVTFSVTANDTDVNGNTTIDVATVDLDPATAGQQTTRTVTGEGTFGADNLGNVTFTPVAGFTGASTITYTVADNTGGVSNSAAIIVNVGPLAANDATSGSYSAAQSINVTTNDVDVHAIRANTVDLDPTTTGRQTTFAYVVSGTTVGNFAVATTGVVTYTPVAGSTYIGTASVNYVVFDNYLPVGSSSFSNVATYTVTLTNTAPVAVNDASSIITGNPVTFNLTANDTDANGNATIVGSTIDLNPLLPGQQNTIIVLGQGTFTTVGAPAGSVTFTPAIGFTGTATASYTVQDAIGATSNVATITVSTAGAPFSCNSVFYRVTLIPTSTTSIVERLDRTSTTSNALTYTSTTLYDTGVQLNALFLNYNDGYLYAFALNTNRLYRLSTTGAQEVGVISGLPAGGFNSATADLSGNAYIANNSTTSLYRLNVATLAVTTLPLSQAVNFGDMGFNPTDGNLYASRFYPGGIFKIDLNAAGATRPVTLLGTPGTTGEDVGSIFFDAAGSLYAATNQGTLAIYDTNSGTVTNIGTASSASQSDGASCVFPVEEIDVVQSAAAPIRINATTFDVTFTTRVKNTGAPVDPNVQVNDFLSTTFPTASTITVVSAPVVTGPGAATLTGNAAFTGQGSDTGLLTGTAPLASTLTATITYTVRVTFASLADVPTTTQFDQVYASTATNNPNTGYVLVNGVMVPPSQVLDGDVSTNSVTPPATPNGDTPSPTPIVFNQPLAFADVYTTPSNTAITVSPVVNDQPGNTGAALVATTIDLNPAVAGQQTTITVAGQGTFTLITVGPNAGQVTFTPALNFTGTAVTPYTVADTNGAISNAVDLTVHVGPLAANDTNSTPYNVAVTTNVTTNDTDVDGLNVATVDLNPAVAGIQTTFTVAGQGTFTVDNAGVVTFTPVTSFLGTATVNYTVQDNLGATSNVASLAVTTTNAAPVAVADTRNTPSNTPVSFNVLTNDSDANGNATINVATVDLDPATAGIQTTFTVAGQGTFTVNHLGVVTFTPALNFTGTATASYTVNDELGATSNVAAITVNVGPIAVANLGTSLPNPTASLTNSGTVNVTTNDTDANGINAATVDLDPAAGIQTTFTVAGQGTFTVNASGVVTFTPVQNFTGVATANYTVQDNTGSTSNVSTVAFNVGPITVNDATTIAYNTPSTTLSVLTNDTDANGINVATVDLDPATAGIQTTFTVAGQGTFTVAATGVVTFTPTGTFVGTTSATYVVTDNLAGNPALSIPATITVTTTSTAPVAVADVFFTPSNTAVTFAPVANDTDAEGNATIVATTIDLDPATAGQQTTRTVAGEGTYTLITVGVNAGQVTFTPVANYTGSSTITYTVQDATGLTSNAANLTVHVGPLAVADATTISYTTPSTTLSVLTNDTDANGINVATVDLNPAVAGTQTTFTVAGQGTFTVNATGVVTFTPTGSFVGSTVANYTVNDNTGSTSNVATITVTTTNTAPVAVADTRNTPSNTPVSFNVLTNDSDANGNATINVATVDLDPATAGIQTTLTVAGQGTFTVNNLGVVTFTPVLNFTGTATASYTVNDELGATSNVAAITVNVGPIAVANLGTSLPNPTASLTNSGTVNVTTNDTDVNGINVATVDLDPATAGIQTTFTVAGQGTFTVAATGVVTFTPATAFTGVATANYTVQDNTGATSNATTVSFNVAPIVVADVASTLQNTPVTVSVLTNDSDANGLNVATVDLDPATAGIQTTLTVAGAGTFSVNPSGQVVFTPVATFTGPVSIPYAVTDNLAGNPATSGPATLTINVTPTYTLSGTVFEDVNYGGGAGRSLAASSGARRPGAVVELYAPDGTLSATKTTDASGLYAFTVPAGNWTVRVVSSSVSSSRPAVAGATDPVLAVPTFVNGNVTRVGGEDPTKADAAANTSQTLGQLTTTTTTAQTLAAVTVGSANLPNVDFGFSFNVVTNTNATGQGSLQQYLRNANGLGNAGLAIVGQPAGTDVSIFMISDGEQHAGLRAGLTNQLTNGRARITLTDVAGQELPTITDAFTIVDGSTQTANIGNSNTGTLAGLTGGNVGTGPDGVAGTGDEPALTAVNAPEVEIDGPTTGTNVPNGLTVGTTNVTLRGLSVHGFQTADVLTTGTSVNNLLLEQLVVGVGATGMTDPGVANQRSNQGIVINTPGSNVIIRQNAIGYTRSRALSFNAGGAGLVGLLVEQNELVSTSRNGNNQAIFLRNRFQNATIRQNRITMGVGATNEAIEVLYNVAASGTGTSGLVVEDNQVQGATGSGLAVSGGNTIGKVGTIQHNVFANNGVAGVNLSTTAGAFLISQNAMSGDGLGIDLTGDGVTINDTGDTDTGVNGLLNFPVLTRASIINGRLMIEGYGRPGVALEVFRLFTETASGFGEGASYLLTTTEGSADDLSTVTGAYGPAAINGKVQGSDNTNKFVFSLPIPAGLTAGSILTATATLGGQTSEFSGNVIVQSNVPLPVELTTFTARPVGRTVVLDWATASERNSAYFVVERSANGLDFAAIGQPVPAAGNSAAPRTYGLVDQQPLMGRSYYRLRQVDLDGTVAYSVIRVVNRTEAPITPVLAVYPNPFTDRVTVDLSTTTGATYALTIFDATGRAVRQLTLAGGQHHELDLATLATGTYVVRVTGADGFQALERLVKE